MLGARTRENLRLLGDCGFDDAAAGTRQRWVAFVLLILLGCSRLIYPLALKVVPDKIVSPRANAQTRKRDGVQGGQLGCVRLALRRREQARALARRRAGQAARPAGEEAQPRARAAFGRPRQQHQLHPGTQKADCKVGCVGCVGGRSRVLARSRAHAGAGVRDGATRGAPSAGLLGAGGGGGEGGGAGEKEGTSRHDDRGGETDGGRQGVWCNFWQGGGGRGEGG